MKQNETFRSQYSDYNLVLFDGVCNFCEASVNFIIKHDSQKKFHFMTQSSEEAEAFMAQEGVEELDTIMLFSKGKLYTHSDAALMIAKELEGWHRHFYIFRFVPRLVRDMVYKVAAKYRYKIFGKKEQCMMPSDEVRERFLGYIIG
ncbi:MAG TPA: DUF393 domain-containing protein [Campylobacterales bacterium]|nr:DUF393 domain-containing protein [Campylobacterales bacterium]HHS91904.1 DUF393 domain-containing protein [Campylobacterales bacterium]